MRYESSYLAHYAKGQTKEDPKYIDRVKNINGQWTYIYPENTFHLKTQAEKDQYKLNKDLSEAKNSVGYSGSWARKAMFAINAQNVWDPTRRRNAATRRKEQKLKDAAEKAEKQRRSELSIGQRLQEDFGKVDKYFKTQKQYGDVRKRRDESLAKAKGMTLGQYRMDKIKKKGKDIINYILGREQESPWVKEKNLLKAKDPDAIARYKNRKTYTMKQNMSTDINTHPEGKAWDYGWDKPKEPKSVWDRAKDVQKKRKGK